MTLEILYNHTIILPNSNEIVSVEQKSFLSVLYKLIFQLSQQCDNQWKGH